MLFRLAVLQAIFVATFAEQKSWTISLDQGDVIGNKYWNGDYYEFYAIPYASVPQGRDRFKGPLPPKPWDGTLETTEENKHIMCPQLAFMDAEPIEDLVVGEEECLVANLFVPTKAKEAETPLPVMVYIHGGAYAMGYGNMVSYQNLLQHDVIVVSFNYRIGAIGFLCLGTEEIPGNAGLRDQVEALKWIKNNIVKFNGNPDDITAAGFTVGASSVELLMMSEAADGLFSKAIADSGSALSPWAVNLDPVSTAKNVAASLGFTGGNVRELTEFYLAASAKSLAAKSVHILHPNSTFGFAPCIENKIENLDSILTESPFKLINEGRFKKMPLLTGFSNMEGISRVGLFDTWSESMNEDFTDFLPADITIPDQDDRDEAVHAIKKLYFDNESVSDETGQGYINYFSDAMFVSSILRSAEYHSKFSKVFLYEFSYVGRLSTEHQFMNTIKGASHRDQTAYILKFGLAYTNNPKDLKTIERMTTMWTNFAKFGKPIPEPSELLDVEWRPYTPDNPLYLSIDEELKSSRSPAGDRVGLWRDLYQRFYQEPTAPSHAENTRIKNEL